MLFVALKWRIEYADQMKVGECLHTVVMFVLPLDSDKKVTSISSIFRARISITDYSIGGFCVKTIVKSVLSIPTLTIC